MDNTPWPRRLIRPVARFVLNHWVRHDEFIRLRQQVRYLALAMILSRSTEQPVDLTAYELSLFSQNGEDGVLQEILRRTGTEGSFFVEIGASSNESNCLLLADAFGWSGVFLEADQHEHNELAGKYRSTPQIQTVRTFVTQANVTETLAAASVPQEFDVLSIDIDGNDYWIWKGITGFKPRIVIIEYNSSLPPDRAVVRPYDPSRRWDGTSSYGASLSALTQLARDKGYRLVHTELSGNNAFFVRRDLAETGFSPEDRILPRAPNYFLYGLRHPDRRGQPLPSGPTAQRDRGSYGKTKEG